MGERVHFIEGVEDIDAYVSQLIKEEEIPASLYELPKEYLSVSQVTMFQRCPRQYFYRYVENVVSPPGSAMVEGSAIHRSLEKALLAKKNNDLLPLDTLLDVYREEWKKAEGVVFEEDENEDKILSRGRRFLTLYREDNLKRIIPIDVEKKFFVTLPGAHVPVLGFIDLIDAGEEDKVEAIVDHKVTGRMKSQFEADSDMQLTLYSHVIGTPKVRFDVFLKNKTPVIKSVSSLRRSADIRWVSKVFTEVARAISTGIFPPCDPKNYMCRPEQCGYFGRCRSES